MCKDKKAYYRKHSVDTAYFKHINTEEKAYWLGFVSADGYVSENPSSYCIMLGLKETDIDHLIKLKTAIRYTGPIRHITRNKSYALCIYSKELVKDLVKLGVRQNKSMSIKNWRGPHRYMKHYWRGVFDGDGSFCQSNKKRKNGSTYRPWTASLVGNIHIIKAFLNFMSENSKNEYKNGSIVRYKNVYRAVFSGIRPAQAVADLLYRGASTYLNRKKILSDDILNTKLVAPIIRHYSKSYLERLHKKHGSWEKVAKALGVSRNGMYKHARKLKMIVPSTKARVHG